MARDDAHDKDEAPKTILYILYIITCLIDLVCVFRRDRGSPRTTLKYLVRSIWFARRRLDMVFAVVILTFN